MRGLLSLCLATTTVLVAQNPVLEPRLAEVLEPVTASQYLLPVRGFSLAELAFGPMPHPALRAGAASFYVPDPLLCAANYVGAEVVQLVYALPQGPIVLLDASSTLALHVLPVPLSTWSSLAGICIDGEHEQVVLLDAAGPRLLRIGLADLRAGTAQFQSTQLPSEWSTVRGIAPDFARDRIVGLVPATGALLQHSVAVGTVLNPSAGALSPVPRLLAFGFAPAGGFDHDLFVSSGDPRMLTSQWTWNDAGPDGGETATLRATVATSAWSPASPDPSAIGFDNIRDRLMVSDGEVEEMAIYAGKNVWEASRAGVVSRSTTTVGYTSEPVGITFQSSPRTFYISDDTTPDAVYVVTVGPDGLLHTSDDTRRSFGVANFPTDPEDTAFSNATNELWIAGGVTNAIHRLRPGPNGIFNGIPPVGDDLILTINVSTFGVTDVEGIAVRPSDGGIYVVGAPITRLLHLSNTGQFVRTIDLPSTGLIKPAGIVFAPRSSGTGDSLYLVDRGIDNEFFPTENDGMLFEYGVPGVGVNEAPVVNAGPDVTVLVTAAATLAGTATDDGLPGPLTIQWSQLSGPGTTTFAAPTQAATTATFSAAGSYTLQLRAFDGEFASTDTCVVTVQPSGGGGAGTVERVVAASTDDAEQGTTAVGLTSSDIELVLDASVAQVVGLRFLNVAIPAGHFVTSAFVQFTTDETGSTATQLTIAGQASDNAATFATVANNISSRPRTTATVAWSPAPWTVLNEAGPNQRTPDIASILQEIMSRPGWSPGNAIALVITGTGTRTAVAFDRTPAAAPRLIVNHAPINQPPVVNAGPDVTTVLTAAASLAGTVIDDGLPGPMTIQWSKLSGPGTVTFAPANQAATTATFSAVGSYTLQLSASDGALTSTDTCVVTVTQPNLPPVVNAGPDLTILITATASLEGTATDDGLPGPLTIQWSRLSGPGTVTFAPANQAATTATFSASGSYTLQLSAFDGELTSTDTCVVTVQQPNQPPVVNAGPDVTVLVTAAANLAGTATDDGLPGPLTIQWSRLSGPGTVTFATPAQAATTATFSAAGGYTLQLRVFDGEFTSTDTCVVTVQQPGVGGSGTVQRVIAASSDDAEQRTSTVNLTSGDLELVVDGANNQVVGLRFLNVAIPAGHYVTSAFVQFTTDEITSIPTQLTIAGQASDNAPTFAATAGNVSSRPRTTATVAWAPAAWTVANQAGVNQRTPDLASILQEIMNRPGWIQGNAIAFVITGTGSRIAVAHDDSQALAAKLIVNHAHVNQPSIVNAGPDVTTLLPAAANLAGTVTDDGQLGPVAIQWTRLSGPGAVTFAAPDQAETTAAFSAPGSYTLQLSAFDGEFTSTDTCVVTVQQNQAPVVDAGPDVTVLLPAAANLAGTVTDDGLPGPLTIQWTKLAGPGAVTFAAPGQAATTAAFSAPGSYTLQLSAFDGEFTITDTCAVTVQQNQPPVVDAGPDVTVLLPAAANLAGTVTDDGLLGPLTIQWTKVSGLGAVTFAAPGQAATTAAFSTPGSYTLQLSAFDGEFTISDTCVVTVQQNQPPVVDAGPDVSVRIPAAAHLAGTVTDDGLPGPMTIQWSKLSGPGAVTFAAPAQAATTAAFSAPGSYTLQLSASDGEFTRTDTCAVTVQQNQPPVVDAGPDVTVLLPAAANLAGTVTDDGLVGPLTIQWSKLSGPGTVTFARGKQAATAATFSAPGSYTLQLSASDSEFTSTDTCVVTVQQNQPPVVDAGPDVTTLLTAAASLAGTVTDDGLPGPLTIQWSKLSGPGTVTFAAPAQAATTAAFSAPGSYTLQLSASDGEFTSTDACVVTVQQPPISSTLQRAIAASADDAEQRPTSVSLDGSDLELVVDGSANQVVGLRFVNLTIPAGATITSAYVQFATDETGATATQLTIQGQASDNAPTFATTAGNISSRPRTTAAVAWAPAAWTIVNEAGPNQRTPNLASIVQEIVNRPGWSPGNAIVLVITGTGTRTASAFDDSQALAARLIVDHESLPPANQPPVVDAGPDVTVAITAPANLAGTVTDDGLPGPLTIQWSKLSGPGTATFATPTQAATTAAFSALGTYTLQLSAFDGEFTSTDTVVVTVQQPPLERAIATSFDDAEESPSSVNLTSGDLELVVDGSTTQVVGIRFQNITIPAGATITSAYVQFATDEATSAATQLTIAGQASDNAPMFAAAAGNISSRPRTTATVAWAPAAWTIANETGPNQRTPNLASIVQEIVSRPGWSPGNAMVLVITGTGTRIAVAYDDSTTLAAKLVVNHQ